MKFHAPIGAYGVERL